MAIDLTHGAQMVILTLCGFGINIYCCTSAHGFYDLQLRLTDADGLADPVKFFKGCAGADNQVQPEAPVIRGGVCDWAKSASDALPARVIQGASVSV